MTEQYRPIPIENPERFQGETKAALQQLIISRQYDGSLGRFRKTHSYSKTPEQQHQSLVSDLGYAIGLHDFNTPSAEVLERRGNVFEQFSNNSVDDEFREELLDVSQEAVQNTKRLDQFAQSLRDVRLNPTMLSVSELIPEVIKGLETYWNISGMVPRHFEDIHGFQRKYIQSFQDIVADPRYTTLLERFRYAYEYKKQIPWRGESGGGLVVPVSPEEAGLPHAIIAALAWHRWGDRDKRPEGAIPINDDFRKALVDASSVATGRMWYLDSFAASLGWSDIVSPKKVDEITVPQLRREVAISLQTYWQRIQSGNSGDPW